jgi:hypothetical protein
MLSKNAPRADVEPSLHFFGAGDIIPSHKTCKGRTNRPWEFSSLAGRAFLVMIPLLVRDCLIIMGVLSRCFDDE